MKFESWSLSDGWAPGSDFRVTYTFYIYYASCVWVMENQISAGLSQKYSNQNLNLLSVSAKKKNLTETLVEIDVIGKFLSAAL